MSHILTATWGGPRTTIWPAGFTRPFHRLSPPHLAALSACAGSMDSLDGRRPLIGVVGPCGAGKSTLVEALERLGFRCRHIAQEHSYVPYMWQRISHPDVLICLLASFSTCTSRRRLNWFEAEYLEQLRRLNHAQQHADLTIQTDYLSPEEVLQQATAFLRQLGSRRASG